MKTHLHCMLVVSVALLALGDTAAASNVNPLEEQTRAPLLISEEAKLIAEDVEADARFGISVALRGERAVVGACPDGGADGHKEGAVYVFEHEADTDKWPQTAKLTAEDGWPGACFGKSVSLSRGRVLAGAPRDDVQGQWSGAAYVFEYDSRQKQWSQMAKLVAGDGARDDLFGSAVDLDGNRAIVAAKKHHQYRGAVYIFEYDADTGGWEQTTKLTGDDGARAFGARVAIDGDRLLVAGISPGHDVKRRVQIFEHNPEDGTWEQTAIIRAPTHRDRLVFATDVALDGDLSIISSPGCNEDDPYSPYCYAMSYFYKRNDADSGWQWTHQKTMGRHTYHMPQMGAAIDGEHAVVGASIGQVAVGGAAYVYWHSDRDDEWEQVATLASSDSFGADHFGETVAISEGRALVGAYRARSAGAKRTGAAYIFDFSSERDTASAPPKGFEQAGSQNRGSDEGGWLSILTVLSALIGVAVVGLRQ